MFMLDSYKVMFVVAKARMQGSSLHIKLFEEMYVGYNGIPQLTDTSIRRRG